MEQPDESISLEEFAQTEQARANSETWNAIPTVRRRKAPPPPTEAQSRLLRDELIAMRNLLASYQSDKYNQGAISYLDYAIEKAETYERKRLAAEARVKDLETAITTLRAGIKSVIKNCDRVVFAEEPYKKACADAKKCLQPLLDRTKSINSTEQELATLRTRLERAEEALRQILEAYLNRNLSNSETFERMSNIAAAYFLPPSPGAVEAGGEEGGGEGA